MVPAVKTWAEKGHMSEERELLSYQPSNTNTILLLCSHYSWGTSLQPKAKGLATQKELDQAFRAHKCEDYATK